MSGPYHPRTAHRRRARRAKLGVADATSLAIGGMVGGGIFTVLGLTVDLAGHLAFLSFAVGGALALLTARAFAVLTLRAQRSGGPFEYLRDAGHPESAAVVAWTLIAGYVFALSVYAFTFGHYVAAVVELPVLFARLLSVVIMAVFLLVNLRGVLVSSAVEDVVVAIKVLVLGVVAAFGLARMDVDRLAPLDDRGTVGVLVGAAVIFVAFEGFELLAYDYDEIRTPARTLPRALYLAVVVVTLLYMAVAVGAQMLVPDSTLVAARETALLEVGRAISGRFGGWFAAFAAALATASAINATLFSASRLMRDVSEAGELPRGLGSAGAGPPRRALVLLAVGGMGFAMVPGLRQLVTFGSLTFLVVFALVDFLAMRHERRWTGRALSGLGMVGCTAAAIVLIVDLFRDDPSSLVVVAVCVVIIGGGRLLFRRVRVSP